MASGDTLFSFAGDGLGDGVIIVPVDKMLWWLFDCLILKYHLIIHLKQQMDIILMEMATFNHRV